MSQEAGDVMEELVKLLGEKVKASATEQLGACTFRQGNKTYCTQLEYGGLREAQWSLGRGRQMSLN